LQKIQNKALEVFQDHLQALYTVFEWLASAMAYIGCYDSSINNSSKWRRLSALSCLKELHNDAIVTEAENAVFLEELLKSGRNEVLARIDSHYIQPNRLKISDIDFLCYRKDGP